MGELFREFLKKLRYEEYVIVAELASKASQQEYDVADLIGSYAELKNREGKNH